MTFVLWELKTKTIALGSDYEDKWKQVVRKLEEFSISLFRVSVVISP
ncbi:hypothetical protein VAE308_930001 [Vibrio aestuarianus]|uniref:Uncharacterized protein n=1 Tax=Vibrio aestuarianus TaxID=28171 RepID=A0ABM9FLS4_9VIBR|nr:hypothetical protein VAE063_140001 [Vibrio aestuarianus]CAH8235160.1 hypothetical protein VAE308_930001 [Vibrio aestuarianus]